MHLGQEDAEKSGQGVECARNGVIGLWQVNFWNKNYKLCLTVDILHFLTQKNHIKGKLQIYVFKFHYTRFI
jgi:lipopolysaccharide/colanic/teichoic acid biosynthesis glycosyltransferase